MAARIGRVINPDMKVRINAPVVIELWTER